MIKYAIHILFFVFLCSKGVGQDASDSLDNVKAGIVGMTVEEFKSKTSNTHKLVLVNLKADWCAICKKEAPIIEEIKSENQGTLEVLVLDTKANPLIADYFEVDGLPVLILYKDGVIVWDHMGAQTKSEIMVEIKAAEYGNR